MYLWNGLIDATGLKYVDTELFNYGYRCYFSRLDSFSSICIKAVASKIMHSVFSIMLLWLQICFWVNGWNLVIDSSHSFFFQYFKTPCAFSKDKIPPWKSKLLTTQTHHLIIHDYTAVSLACLPVSYCWSFAWVHRTYSEVCLVHQCFINPSFMNYFLTSCV